MGGLTGRDGGDPMAFFCPHAKKMRGDVACNPGAQWQDGEHAVALDGLHDESDLIQMGVKLDAQSVTGIAVTVHVHVLHVVQFGRTEYLYALEHLLGDLMLEAGWPVGL